MILLIILLFLYLSVSATSLYARLENGLARTPQMGYRILLERVYCYNPTNRYKPDGIHTILTAAIQMRRLCTLMRRH